MFPLCCEEFSACLSNPNWSLDDMGAGTNLMLWNSCLDPEKIPNTHLLIDAKVFSNHEDLFSVKLNTQLYRYCHGF